MLVKILSFLYVAMLTLSCGAYGEVNVARIFSTHVFDEAVNINAGQYWVYPLPGVSPGDLFKVSIGTSNEVWRDISAYVMDEKNLQRFKSGMQFQAPGQTKGNTPFQFEATRPRSGQLYLVLDNRYALFITKKALVEVKLTTLISDEAVRKAEELYGKLYVKLKEMFVFKDFDINQRPCGRVNAFSAIKTGDITICTELLSMYANKASVVKFTFTHEVGHTLLGLWGLPGGDNEDIADEFASNLIIRSKDGPSTLIEALDFFNDSNPYAEAKYVIEHGDRHSLSVQRIRNIRMHLEQPKALTAKWNRLLYPHLTETALNKIINSPDSFDDVVLAKLELSRRSGNAELAIPIPNPTMPVGLAGCSKDTDCKGDRICERDQCIWPSATSGRTLFPARSSR